MRKSGRAASVCVAVIVAAAIWIGGCSRTEPAKPATPEQPKKPAATAGKAASSEEAISRGLEFLRGRQAEDGAFRSGEANLPVDLGVTGLVVEAIAKAPGTRTEAEQATISKGVGFLLAHQEADGGIRGEMLGNYTTCIAICALEALNDAKYKDNIDRAVAYVKKQQCSGVTGPDSYKNGGFGYGSTPRPDLSNTQMALDAFQAAGLSKDDPAYKDVVVFLSRCQNNSETNDQEYAEGVNDGGGVYSPVESKAGEYKKPDGDKGLRSYGSMTYALLKSMLYANLSKDDPRVKAAVGWVKKNYSLDENPGMGKQGLYYYFHTFAKAMAAYGQDMITDDKGVQHDWRKDLVAKLIELQKADGSWTNEADRWNEGSPGLVTCYSILALEEAMKKGEPTARTAP